MGNRSHRTSFTRRGPAVLALAAAVLVAYGCRSGADEGGGEEHREPDAGGFDTDTYKMGDGGPGALCPDGAAVLFNNRYSPYFGGEESVDLVVENHSNFHCPHCAALARTAAELWEARPDFRARVRFYFHHHPWNLEETWELHYLAAAAGQQGMEHFWAMHDRIYEGMRADPQRKYDAAEMTAFARNELGLDMKRLSADLEEMKVLVAWDYEQGASAGITGTPSVYLCGVKINWLTLEAALDGYLGD